MNKKDCPFCGFEEIVEDSGVSFCTNCGATADTSSWNTRPIEDALTAEIARMRDMLNAIAKMVLSAWDVNMTYVDPLQGASIIAQEAIDLRARVAELEALVIEANAAYTTNHEPEPIDVAALGLVAMCYHGADALVKVAELEADARWVSVKQGLPTEDGVYLVYYGDSDCYGAEHALLRPVTASPVFTESVTHWRPLPAPPEAE